MHLRRASKKMLHIAGVPLRLTEVCPDSSQLITKEGRVLAPPPGLGCWISEIQQSRVAAARPPVAKQVRLTLGILGQVPIGSRYGKVRGKLNDVWLRYDDRFETLVKEVSHHRERIGPRGRIPANVTHVIEPVKIQYDCITRNLFLPHRLDE